MVPVLDIAIKNANVFETEYLKLSYKLIILKNSLYFKILSKKLFPNDGIKLFLSISSKRVFILFFSYFNASLKNDKKSFLIFS